MENWGLITFRETRLIVNNDENSSVSAKMGVALTVAHEISHMWFGDLGINLLSSSTGTLETVLPMHV